MVVFRPISTPKKDFLRASLGSNPATLISAWSYSISFDGYHSLAIDDIYNGISISPKSLIILLPLEL